MTENELTETADLDDRRTQRSTLKAKHAQSLTKLMGTRSDLRGVHALADHLDDAVRWTA